MALESFDLIVLGGGKAGRALAMDQARAGRKVALIDSGRVGGAAINTACIPGKALIHAAQRHALDRRAGYADSGDSVMAEVAARTAAIVGDMADAEERALTRSGVALVRGRGRFLAPHTIEVAGDAGLRQLTAPAICLNLGTRAFMPDIPGLAAARPMTHIEALRLENLPQRLIVLGGGHSGLELAQAFRRLGSEVAVVEVARQVAPCEDPDVSAALQVALEADGVMFALGAAVLGVTGLSGERVNVRLANGRIIEGSHLLVTAGRQPMTRGIGLDVAGVDLDSRGFIKVDSRLRTTADGVWAMGEVTGSPMLTHASLDDYRVVASGFAGGGRTTAGRLVPFCLFTDPELARIGLNETQAALTGVEYRLAMLRMDAVPRARTLGDGRGFMKALVDADDRILGFTMMGAHAGDVMAAVQMAMLGGLRHTDLRDAILAHPTLAEGLGMLFATVPPALRPRAMRNAESKPCAMMQPAGIR